MATTAKNRIAEVNGTHQPEKAAVTIAPLNLQTLRIRIRGTAPLLMCKFSEKAKQAIMSKMAEGSTAKTKKKREARDYDEDMRQATHYSTQGWIGIPASAFRNACIDACRMVGFKMTHAKMAIFFRQDGIAPDGTPLIRLDADAPVRSEMYARPQMGVVDIRVRPMWPEWGATLTLTFDADQFTASDVVNLLSRAGQQVGILEGRPFSKESCGMGMGTFEIVNEE